MRCHFQKEFSQETYGVRTCLSSLHADSWLFRSALAGWSPETHRAQAVSKRSHWAGRGIPAAWHWAAQRGKGGRCWLHHQWMYLCTLDMAMLWAGLTGLHAPSVGKKTIFVTTVTCHSASLNQSFRCFKKVIKALFNVKLNNEIFTGLEIHAFFKGLRFVATCANDMELYLFKPLLFSFLLSAYKFDTIQFN